MGLGKRNIDQIKDSEKDDPNYQEGDSDYNEPYDSLYQDLDDSCEQESENVTTPNKRQLKSKKKNANQLVKKLTQSKQKPVISCALND